MENNAVKKNNNNIIKWCKRWQEEVCLFFLWILKSDVWVTEESQPPGGMKAVEIYVRAVLLWYLKDLDEKEPSQMFWFWFQTLMEKPPLQLCSIWISPPIPSYIHPHTPPSSTLQRPSQECFSPWLASLCVSLAPLTTLGPGTWRTDR